MPRRVFRHILADSIQIGTAAAHKALPLSPNQREYFEYFIRRFNSRIHQNLALQRNVPRLGEECKREACRQTESVLAVAAAMIELQFEIGRSFAFLGNV